MTTQLTNLTDLCGVLKIAGWGAFGYVTCTDEIKKQNRSKRDMAAAGAAPVLGELLEVGEAPDFTAAPVGKGYFRTYSVVVDTPELDGTWTSGSGSVKFEHKFKLRIGGMDTPQMEWMLSLVGCCGLSFVHPDKNGVYWELGNKLNPAKLDSVKIVNGQDAYLEAEVMVTYPPRKWDVVAIPIDDIPNA